jgi:hypothetical protein
MRLPDRYSARLGIGKTHSLWVCSACFYMLISREPGDDCVDTGSPHTLALPLGQPL